jgi:hypothetical protein
MSALRPWSRSNLYCLTRNGGDQYDEGRSAARLQTAPDNSQGTCKSAVRVGERRILSGKHRPTPRTAT